MKLVFPYLVYTIATISFAYHLLNPERDTKPKTITFVLGLLALFSWLYQLIMEFLRFINYERKRQYFMAVANWVSIFGLLIILFATLASLSGGDMNEEILRVLVAFSSFFILVKLIY